MRLRERMADEAGPTGDWLTGAGLAHAPVGVALTDASGRFVVTNPTLRGVLARSEEELRTLVYDGLLHPDDRPGEDLHRRMLLAGDVESYTLEPRLLRPSGEIRRVTMRASLSQPGPDRPRVSRHGQEVLIIRRVLDVTDLRRAEAERDSAEELVRCVFNDSPVGILMVDRAGRILRANPALCQLLGYAEGEMVGRPSAEVVHPDDVDLDTDLVRRLFAGEIPGYAIEKRYLRKDGEVVWGRLQASIVHGEEGQPLHRLDIVEDITEERTVDAARREHDALKDTFLRVVAHDLQNPLVAIAGLAGILAEGPADMAVEEQRRILGRIAHHAERLKDTVASFLDLDRLRQGAVAVRRCPTDVAQLARQVAESCDRGDHPLSVEAVAVVAPVDPDLTEHILTNLLQNAITHTPPGTPVWIRVGQEPGGVTLAVEDAGHGVPDELKQAGFELFRTGDPEARRTGVGLWVVARMAELHGGRAWVEDRPVGGAAFHVLLPPAPPEGETTS